MQVTPRYYQHIKSAPYLYPANMHENMTFEFNFLNRLNNLLTAELPTDLRSLDQHLDFIIPKINEYGEDIREMEYWTNKRWKEVRESEQFHEAILHFSSACNIYIVMLKSQILQKHSN
jgi:hypothetical protein